MTNIETNEVQIVHSDWILSQQLKTYHGTVKASIIGNVVNSLMIAGFFHATLGVAGTIALCLYTFAAAVLRYGGLRRYNQDGIKPGHERSFVRKLNIHAAVLGASWGGVICWLMSISGQTDIAFLGMVAAGMMCAGAISFSSLPGASRNYIGIVGALTLAGLLSSATAMTYMSAGMLLSYGFVLIRAVSLSYGNLITRLMQDKELQTSSETVKLLLNDFEEHGSDWLWEVSQGGKIVSPSTRFADAVQRPVQTLADTALIELFDVSPERDILNDHILHFRAFRDVIVPLTIDGERCWWSLSGRSIESDTGASPSLRGVATDISAAKNAEVKVAYMAHYDGLTDLPNRFLFNETLNRAINRRKDNAQFAVLSLDLDHFKSVNDTLGHPAGDELLKIVSRRIEGCIKERDMVARLGGDEFAILLTSDQTVEQVSVISDRIIEAVSQPIDLGGNQVLCGTSVGIVLAPKDGSTVEALLKHVDLALYSAKENGRNRAAFFELGMDDAAQARREIEMDLRTAMANDELALHYQPLIDLETGGTIGYEALLRWNHPVKGLIMPNDFVSIAEETGLIVQLGEWVIRNAVAEVARWPEHLAVAVNLSPVQMKSAGLISTIINALASSGVAAQRLELEITESVLMYESEANLATLHKIRDLGVRIALDDFGTGYSSLNYLRSFPFDKIKIDRCFVQDVDSREDCQAIVRAVTGLASSLGMVTTAEGVENEEQLAQLRLEGCTQVQGFLYSKAVSANQLTNLRPDEERPKRKAPTDFLPAAALPVQTEKKRKRA